MDEVDEVSTSSGAGSYNTPKAFSKNEKDWKRRAKKLQSGFEIVNEEFTLDEYEQLRELIRRELAHIYFDLFKKRKMWAN